MDLSESKSRAWQRGGVLPTRYLKWTERKYDISFIYLEPLMRTIDSFKETRTVVADVGCGTGVLSVGLKQAGYEVVGLDLSPEMLQAYQSRPELRTLPTHIFDIRETCPIHLEGRFDLAVSRWVLPHFPDWDRHLENVIGLLKPGGRLIFEMPCRESLDFALMRGSIDWATYEYDFRSQELADAGKFYAAASYSQIEEAAKKAGAYVEKTVPFGLLAANPLIAVALGSRYSAFKSTRDRLIRRSRAVRKLIALLEAALTLNLPDESTLGRIIVLRRTPF